MAATSASVWMATEPPLLMVAAKLKVVYVTVMTVWHLLPRFFWKDLDTLAT